MRCMHSLRNIVQYSHLFFQGHAGMQLSQRLAMNVLGRDVQLAGNFSGFVHLAHVGMLNAGLRLGFAQKALRHPGIIAAQKFQRDVPLEPDILCEKDASHAAMSDVGYGQLVLFPIGNGSLEPAPALRFAVAQSSVFQTDRSIAFQNRVRPPSCCANYSMPLAKLAKNVRKGHAEKRRRRICNRIVTGSPPAVALFPRFVDQLGQRGWSEAGFDPAGPELAAPSSPAEVLKRGGNFANAAIALTELAAAKYRTLPVFIFQEQADEAPRNHRSYFFESAIWLPEPVGHSTL